MQVMKFDNHETFRGYVFCDGTLVLYFHRSSHPDVYYDVPDKVVDELMGLPKSKTFEFIKSVLVPLIPKEYWQARHKTA